MGEFRETRSRSCLLRQFLPAFLNATLGIDQAFSRIQAASKSGPDRLFPLFQRLTRLWYDDMLIDHELVRSAGWQQLRYRRSFKS